MRLDKFLKIARLVKRRTVANQLAAAGRVLVNDKIAKPGTNVAVGDTISLTFGQRVTRVQVLDLREIVRKEEAAELYELLTD